MALVDSGDLRVDITRRVALADLPALHAEAAASPISGKAIVLPPASLA